MNATDFRNIISGDLDLSDQTRPFLMDLRNRYPYSGLLHLLIAKNNKKLEHLDFEASLNKAAIHLPSREILFQHIMGDLTESAVETDKEIVVIDEKEDFDEVETEKNLTEHTVDTKVIDSNPRVDRNNKTEQENKSGLEEQILNEAISSSIAIDISEYESLPELEKDLKEEDSEMIEGVGSDKPTAPITSSPQPKSFVDWLTPNETKEADKTLPKKKPSELIDAFLTGNISKVSKPSDETPSLTINKEDKDTAYDPLVTETLATIYAKQEKYEEAIQIYERLILKNPEKKTFFASRIRFLQEKNDRKTE